MIAASLMIAAGVLVSGGCGDGNSPTGEKSTVTLDITDLVMKIGEEKTLVASADPDGTAIVWSSDNESVAVVDNGKVTAVSQGSAAICASTEGGSDFCQITVTAGGSIAADDEIKKEGYIYHEDFDERGETVPGYFKQVTAGGGSVSVANGEMTLATSGGGTAFASYMFDEALSGKIIAETRVKVMSRSFSNVLFFYRGEAGYDNGDIIACLGMDAGGFKNHNGSGWSGSIKSYSVNTWYEIKMELNIGKSKYDLWINGEKQPSQTLRNRGDGVGQRKRCTYIRLYKNITGRCRRYSRNYSDRHRLCNRT